MRTSLIPNTPSQKKYTQLLWILTLRLIAAPFLKEYGEIVLSLLLLWAIFLIIRTFYLYQKFFLFYLIVAVSAFLLEVIARLGNFVGFETVFVICVYSVYAIYLGIAAWLIMRDIFFSSEVTIDTVFGGICVYLLVGFLWSLFYGVVQYLDTNAFSQSLTPEGFYSTSIYLSFTTLTTLGYGDILPVNPFAMMLTNLEAIIGQMYPAIFIAILVGAYLSQRNNQES